MVPFLNVMRPTAHLGSVPERTVQFTFAHATVWKFLRNGHVQRENVGPFRAKMGLTYVLVRLIAAPQYRL
jgi:hypothetical protein